MVMALALHGPAAAGTADPQPFDIPAQPLGGALQAFGQVTQTHILYDSQLRGARRSSAVKGVYAPPAAMQALLAGTGLRAEYTAAGDVVLVPAAAASSAQGATSPDEPLLSLATLVVTPPVLSPELADNHAERWYAAAVQAEIQRALRRDVTIRSGTYRVLARVWITASGTVQRLALAESTGDRDRDGAITQALIGLALGRPPQGLRQPLGILLTASR